MPQNMMEKPKTAGAAAECTAAVAYFTAKLGCEMMPSMLKDMMDKNMLNDMCLIDVRPMEEYKKCHIPLALCVPMGDLASRMSSFPKNKTVVAYCGDMTCGLAAKACLEMAGQGFKVMELCGGMDAWMKKGYPVDKKA